VLHPVPMRFLYTCPVRTARVWSGGPGSDRDPTVRAARRRPRRAGGSGPGGVPAPGPDRPRRRPCARGQRRLLSLPRDGVPPPPPPTHTHSHTCLHTHTHARTHAHKQTPIRTRAHIFFFRETVSVNLLFSGQIFTSHAHSCTPVNCRHTSILIISTFNKERGRSQAGC